MESEVSKKGSLLFMNSNRDGSEADDEESLNKGNLIETEANTGSDEANEVLWMLYMLNFYTN